PRKLGHLSDEINKGVGASLEPRGRSEEHLGLGGVSLGVIAIDSGPISCVNVRKEGDEDGNEYFVDYVIPDPRLAGYRFTVSGRRGRWLHFVREAARPLVLRHDWTERYRCFSLMRASAVVNCQSMMNAAL